MLLAVIGLAGFGFSSRPRSPGFGTERREVVSASHVDSASRRLDQIGFQMEHLEEAAYNVTAGRFFEDAEDAQSSRQGFYLSSVKVFKLAVAADSMNAEALFHLGHVLAQKGYTGFGNWSADSLTEAVSILEKAEARAVGVYATLRPRISRELSIQRENLKASKQ